MIKISYIQKFAQTSLIVSAFALIGCSGSGTTPLGPSDIATMTFDHNAASLDYTELGVVVDVPAGTVDEGEVVILTVQVAPPNLPERAYSDAIHSRIGWLNLGSASDPDINLQEEIRVVLPLNDNYTASEIYSVFFYNQSDGLWH